LNKIRKGGFLEGHPLNPELGGQGGEKRIRQCGDIRSAKGPRHRMFAFSYIRLASTRGRHQIPFSKTGVRERVKVCSTRIAEPLVGMFLWGIVK